MKIISVAGTSSETGKTTIGTFIIRAFKNICALKITVRHEGSCPRHKGNSCDGCLPSGNSLYRIITDPVILAQSGKDTARYLRAGALKVVWLQTHSQCAKESIRKSLNLYNDTANVLIEGNRFLAVGDADLAIMVVPHDLKKIKRSATEVLEKIDLFIINKRPDISEKIIASTKTRLISMGCKSPIIIIDLHNPEPIARDTLLDMIREVINPPVGVVL